MSIKAVARIPVASKYIRSFKRNGIRMEMPSVGEVSQPAGLSAEAGPSSLKRAADKWVKPNGPPVGVTFGGRKLRDEEDIFSQNAWYVM
jgi:hypothetical protein